MDPFEANNHSFIVRIWREDSGKHSKKAKWRGHITHVPSGERRYLNNLDDIAAFIVPYLEGTGTKIELCRRVKQWLTRWKRHLMRQI